MEDCIFCKIVKGDIPCIKVYEDDDVLAFLDISQTTKGHTLVIPKEHYDTFLSMPKTLMHKVMNVTQTIGQSQICNLHAKGVNILTNCYEAAGQTIKHCHIHVIPRYDDSDGLVIEFKENKLLEQISLPAVANSIKEDM